MSHIKIATYGLPKVRVPKIHIALPYYKVGRDDDEYEEEKHHDGISSRSHESVSVMADVHERMEYPPHTWASYDGKPGGMMAIVEMEYRELMECKAEGHKAGIEKELTDLAAACLCALEKMKSM